MKLTNKQLGKLHVGRRQIGLSDDDWRALLARVVSPRATSSTDLNNVGFDLVWGELVRLGAKDTTPRHGPAFGVRVQRGMATDGQLEMIRGLWRQYAESETTDRQLERWLEGKFKVSALRFLPGWQVAKVIHALKAMVNHRNRKRAALAAQDAP